MATWGTGRAEGGSVVVGHENNWIRFWSAALLIVSAVMVTSCSKSNDVWIANPCDAPLEVRTFDIPSDKIDGEEPNERAEIPALSVGKIDSAFSDAAGDAWSIQIAGFDTVFPVDGDQLSHDTFVVPAEVCGAP